MVKFNLRRVLVMCLGIVIMGLGISLFKISLMGNDPSSAMVMALGDRLGIDFSVMLIIMNSLFFLVEIFLGRRYIGIGTFVNWFCVGILASFYTRLITSFWTVPNAFLPRLALMGGGVLVLSLSASLYQTADLGISPYDSLSIIMRDLFCDLLGTRWYCRTGDTVLCAGAGAVYSFLQPDGIRKTVWSTKTGYGCCVGK